MNAAAWIELTKSVGFPVAVGGFLLFFFKNVVYDMLQKILVEMQHNRDELTTQTVLLRFLVERAGGTIHEVQIPVKPKDENGETPIGAKMPTVITGVTIS